MFSAVLCCALLFFAVLSCSLVFSAVIWCSQLSSAVLWCSQLFSGVLSCSQLFSAVLWCSQLLSGVLWCSQLFSDVLCCSLLFSAVFCCFYQLFLNLLVQVPVFLVFRVQSWSQPRLLLGFKVGLSHDSYWGLKLVSATTPTTQYPLHPQGSFRHSALSSFQPTNLG